MAAHGTHGMSTEGRGFRKDVFRIKEGRASWQCPTIRAGLGPRMSGGPGVWLLALLCSSTGCGDSADHEQTAPEGHSPNSHSVVHSTDASSSDHETEGADGSLPTLPGESKPRAAKIQQLSPTSDGWDTEVLHDQAKQQLKVLAHGIEPGAKLPFESLVGLEFRWEEDRESAGGKSEGRWLRVESPEPYLGTEKGPGALQAALQHWWEPFAGSADAHVYFKLITVEPAESSFATRVDYEASGTVESGRCQQNATWQVTWSYPEDSSAPRLLSIQVTAAEQVRSTSQGPLFTDATSAVLGNNASYQAQLVPSLDHWRGTLPAGLGLTVYGHEGLAIGDVNGDDRDDVLILQPGGLPHRLFVQQEDGTAMDRSAESGLDLIDPAHGALFIDLDQDGDQDLALAVGAGVALFSNDSTGVFTHVRRLAAADSLSLSAADYDRDGNLDLYVCCYTTPDGDVSVPIPYHDANNGHPNYLFRNLGGWHFEDVTEAAGLQVNNERFSFASSWEDFDNDGDPDLYVANDFGRNNLYRNDSGTFQDIAAEAGVEDISAGMSVTWGDYNNDGWMDLYVSNMFSSAGNRITFQRQFKTDVEGDVRAQFQRHARGNSLFENAGDGTFRDVSVAAGVTMGRWAWGSKFLDFNNDGREDLLVANGFITNEEKHDL